MPYSLMSPLSSLQSFLNMMSKHRRTIVLIMCLKRLYDILTSWRPHWLGRLPLLGWPVRGSKGPTRKHTFHMRTNQSRVCTVSHLLCLALTVQEKRVLRLNHPELNTRQVDPTLIARSPPPPCKLDNPTVSPALPGVSHRNKMKALPLTPASAFWLWCFPMQP